MENRVVTVIYYFRCISVKSSWTSVQSLYTTIDNECKSGNEVLICNFEFVEHLMYIRSTCWRSVIICLVWLPWSLALNMAGHLLNYAADIYFAIMTTMQILSWKCLNSGICRCAYSLTLGMWRSQEKFAFVECEFHKTNPFECKCKFNQTITRTALFIIKIKKSNSKEVRK